MQWHSEPEGGQFSELLKSSGGNNERSPWNIAAAAAAEGINGSAFLERIRFYHQLRMNLLPYLYSEARCCVRDRKPLTRPLIYDWPRSEAACKASESGQFMLGSAVLVAPVLEPGKDSHTLWLPDGEWYGFFDNRPYSGPAWIDVPCGDGIPVFVKSGSPIPLNCSVGS
jgi:alpha-D-xyloside xylohydrolase